MHSPRLNAPLPIGPPPDAAAPNWAPLLCEPFARVWDDPAAPLATAAVRERLLERIAASRLAESIMTTVRRQPGPREALASGVSAQLLYTAPAGRAPRPGEPSRVRLFELAAGATLAANETWPTGRQVECLVLRGSVVVDGQLLSQRDYRIAPAGQAGSNWHAASGACLFVRESESAARPGDRIQTVLDAQAGWPDFAPGIQRRVLWQRDGQAALLYYARPGAQVPSHSHGHDEECLMVQGELFLDDLLLQPGDYQLAPAGSGHRVTETDTGVVIYAHGDLDLRFIA